MIVGQANNQPSPVQMADQQQLAVQVNSDLPRRAQKAADRCIKPGLVFAVFGAATGAGLAAKVSVIAGWVTFGVTVAIGLLPACCSLCRRRPEQEYRSV